MDTKALNNIIDPIYHKILRQGFIDNLNVQQILYSTHPNQIACKSWLVNQLSELPVHELKIQLYGGWYGFPLIDMLMDKLDISYIENIDLDPEAIKICKRYIQYKNLNKSFIKTRLCDVSESRDTDKTIDLVINTSSEHMDDLPVLIKDKKYKRTCIFALQSNNMFHHSDHINCVNNVEELIEKSGLTNILYSGTLNLDEYKRYMVIGLV